MTFSTTVKTELMKRELEPCCKKAMTYGLLLFGKDFSASSIRLSTEHRYIAEYYAKSIKEQTGIEPIITASGKNKKYVASIKTNQLRAKVLECFGHTGKEIPLRLNRANIQDECCFGAFLAGAFISCGTVTTPEKNYHMEFSTPYQRLCKDLMNLMNELDLNTKLMSRDYAYSLYIKNSECIEDVLTTMGATQATLKVMGTKIQKDIINNANRRANFDNANIARTVDASAAQREAIKRLRKKGAFNSLDETTKLVAVAREENPIASLSEMETILEGRISRSGINHRLKKIVRLAEDTK
ncbi:MAG: DNA-binding protein WhiA [Clostridiales bacterium]|nr:DNA-binding protein WhiA [Clostridiales bacterium]